MLDNVAAFQGEHPPLLIIHGTRDKLLSYKNAQDLFNEATEPKVLYTVPEGEHGCFGEQREFFALLNEFLAKNDL